MSGSAALASARRRRTSQTSIIPSKPENTIMEEQPKTTPINPGVLLLKHNQMLSMLQNDLGMLKNQLKNINVEPEQNDPENINYFKKQYADLLEEMKEVKKTLLKVQTFSMETNLEVMKLKRLIKPENDVENIKIE